MKANDEAALIKQLQCPETQHKAFEQVVRQYSEQLYWQIRRMEKKRTETISWHSLRHTYAQRTYEEALKERPKKARKIVSENLGHHRTEVTRIYLADKPKTPTTGRTTTTP